MGPRLTTSVAPGQVESGGGTTSDDLGCSWPGPLPLEFYNRLGQSCLFVPLLELTTECLSRVSLLELYNLVPLLVTIEAFCLPETSLLSATVQK